MNDEELKRKVHSAAYNLISSKGFMSPIDIILSIGVLSGKDYYGWRFSRITYLERVCKANLRKLSMIMREIRCYAHKNSLKPSWTAYNKWGKGRKTPLRFSKSGDPKIEEAYATHFVDLKRMSDMRNQVNTSTGCPNVSLLSPEENRKLTS